MFRDHTSVSAFRHGAHLDEGAAFQWDEEHGGDAGDAKGASQPLLHLGVDFIDGELAVVFFGQAFHDGSHPAAGTAPIRVKVHNGSGLSLENESVGALFKIPNLVQETLVIEVLDLGIVVLGRGG